MNHSDIAALMKGAAPVIHALVAGMVEPLTKRIGDLEAELAVAKAVDHGDAIRSTVAEAVASIPQAPAGKDADPAEVARLVNEAVAALPPPAPGKDADPELVASLVAEKVAEAVKALPPAEPGRNADPEATAALVRTEVELAVAALPPPEPGKGVTVEEFAPMVDEAVSKAIAQLPGPEAGKPGPEGKLPLVKAWEDRVYREAEVITFEGATYQAQRDTGKPPNHEDWLCIAAAGRDGDPAKQIDIKGTYDPDSTYFALNVVALNGGTFIAKRDDPGACPGEGWQLMSAQGKTGKPGEGRKGDPGQSVKGPPGPPVVAAHINDEGLLTLVNADGSTVECDLYPLLAKVI